MIDNARRHALRAQMGGMLVELMLSVALAALIIPFVFRYQTAAVRRSENIAYARRMDTIRGALEHYIMDHRAALLAPVGKNITRVKLADLAEYGVSTDIIDGDDGRYQLRVLKSADRGSNATLQGVVVFAASDLSPVRTREIINLGGDNMGFIEDNQAFGAFGSWRADALDLGVGGGDAIVDTTGPLRGGPTYLWRLPSNSPDDATMAGALSLGGHDITDVRFFDGTTARFDEYLRTNILVADTMVFQTRPTLDRQFESPAMTVAGTLGADSRNLEIAGTLTMNDLGKFSSFTTGDLWAANLTLGGLSIHSDVDTAVLKINKNLDMTGGRITAIRASVAFTGSITPRMVVRDRIEDSVNASYYWDVAGRSAYLMDVSLGGLRELAPAAASRERGTDAARIFGAVAGNRNATAADYMNAIEEIARRVREKYRGLNLQ